jgi:flagellar basal-body rod protein FlgG
MLQGIIYQATQNGQMHMNSLDKVTRNVANYNTTGYKSQRFDLFLGVGDRVTGYTRTDTTLGNPLMTRNELDVAIETPGVYFPVTQADGKVAYTRDGRFSLNKDGYLVTPKGDLIGTGINVPPNYGRLLVYPDGTVMVQPKKEGPRQTIGKLAVVGFRNPEGLESIGDNKLVATPRSGGAYAVEKVQLAQGKLENSNVDLYEQIDSVMRLNAGVLSNYRVIKYSDDLFRQAANLRQ